MLITFLFGYCFNLFLNGIGQNGDTKEIVLGNYYSENKEHCVGIILIGEAQGFEAQPVKITVDNKNLGMLFYVKNDGKKWNNYLIEWISENEVKIVLKGEEQVDQIIQIKILMDEYLISVK